MYVHDVSSEEGQKEKEKMKGIIITIIVIIGTSAPLVHYVGSTCDDLPIVEIDSRLHPTSTQGLSPGFNSKCLI